MIKYCSVCVKEVALLFHLLREHRIALLLLMFGIIINIRVRATMRPQTALHGQCSAVHCWIPFGHYCSIDSHLLCAGKLGKTVGSNDLKMCFICPNTARLNDYNKKVLKNKLEKFGKRYLKALR